RSIMFISEAFGLPGNIFVLVLAFKSRRTTSRPYITVLGIFDLYVLIFEFPFFTPDIIFPLLAKCDIIVFFILFSLFQTCRYANNWFLSFLSIERCMAVCLPIQKRKWLSVRRVYISIVGTTLILF
ncbi:hypothetical protein EGW08_004298, partial [Elysia chlorotica]